MKIVISSGHGKYVPGAIGPEPWGLDEHAEAVRVVNKVAEYLHQAGVDVVTYEDTVSRSQSENLDRIVDFHNSQTRDLDVSVHFNAYEETTKPMGTECLYVTQEALAADVSRAIASVTGLPNRGPKYRGDLAFLNGTEEPAVLVETVFVDSEADVKAYNRTFEALCSALAAALSGEEVETEPEPEGVLFRAVGKCSWFGGPEDTGVSASEGLAFIFDVDEAPHLFLPVQPEGTTGLARRLNPGLFYVACRWDYDVTPKGMLANPQRQALVRAKGKEFLAWPADWGPHESTDREADLSPGLLEALGVGTDEEVEVIYPAPTDV